MSWFDLDIIKCACEECTKYSVDVNKYLAIGTYTSAVASVLDRVLLKLHDRKTILGRAQMIRKVFIGRAASQAGGPGCLCVERPPKRDSSWYG